MTHYNADAAIVRGELFRASDLPTSGSAKWKYTVQIDMQKHYNDLNIYDAVAASFRETPASIRGVVDGTTGYLLVVFEPYHKNAYPVAVMI